MYVYMQIVNIISFHQLYYPLQFPVIFTLMFSIGVCLFIQPFKSIYVNLIEAFLAASILILLELPSSSFDSSFKTTFYVLSEAGVDQCIGVNAITKGSSLITMVYLLPLATFIGTVIIRGALLLRYMHHSS